MVRHRLKNRREIGAGLLMLAFGALAMHEGVRLGIGTLKAMGPGYVPLALGAALAVLGVAIALSNPAPEPEHDIVLHRMEWRGWGCILAGVVGFIVLGLYTGLVPATLASVFVAAMGDRTATVKGSVLLSVGVTVFGVALFYYALRVPIPLFAWGRG